MKLTQVDKVFQLLRALFETDAGADPDPEPFAKSSSETGAKRRSVRTAAGDRDPHAYAEYGFSIDPAAGPATEARRSRAR